ncbi:Nrap protein [Phlyctochytrium arcticum]|nr:Nrap protein [Phlyctochytrium arcticum]
MVAVKRKAAASGSGEEAGAKKRPAVVLDPYIDASDDDDSASDDEEGQNNTFVEEDNDSDTDHVTGEANGEESTQVGKPRKERPSGDKLFKAPTNEEIQELKGATDLFKSNLFKLQIEELLKEVRVDYTRTTPLEKALRVIKETLDSAQDIEDLSVSHATSGLASEGIHIPFPEVKPPSDAQYKFGFKKPTKVFVVGSYLMKTLAKGPSGSNVDLAIQMPESLFQEKDHVNYRYFYKRAYYLSVLAAELKKRQDDLGITLEFEAFQNDRRRPILVLRSTGSVPEYNFAKLGFQIRIFVTIPSTVFPPARLAPGRNNVRPSYISPNSTADHTPTPHYNAALLHDTTPVTHMNILHQHVTNCAGFRDACILAKVWLNQRGFGQSGDFNGFLFAMIMGYLLRTNDKHGNRRLGNSFSPYQLLKVTIEFIATNDFKANPLFMTADGKPLEDSEFSASAFAEQYDVVIVGPSGKINLAAGMSTGDLDKLQHEARHSLELLNDNQIDRFDSLFLKKVEVLHLSYDNIAHVAPLTKTPKAYTTAVALDIPCIHQFARSHIPALLKRALTNRVRLICARSDPLGGWPCEQEPPSFEQEDIALQVGIILDAEHSNRAVEHGPSAEDAVAAAEFRELWGDKAEVRRFKDGSILESVLFESDGTLELRALIVQQMVAHLLERHFGVNPRKGLQYWSGQFNRFIHAPGIVQEVKTFQGVMDAYNAFSKHLRSLDGLPLSISQTIPVAEGLRYCSVFIPQPKMTEQEAAADTYRPYHAPLDVVIVFESSGSWPDDVEAIQLTKRAFYLKIASLFKEQHPGTRTTVSTGEGEDLLDCGYLEVTTTERYTFRCSIHVPREAILFENGLAERDVDSARKSALIAAQSSYERRFIKLPAHADRIRQLCVAFPFLTPTIRITKRWIGAHLLSTQINPELLELICAKVFVDPSPWEAPASAWAGFARVLDLFRTWDWARDPLIVETEKGVLTTDVRAKINEQFRQSRGLAAQGAAPTVPLSKLKPVMFVATERDIEGSYYSSEHPEFVIVERIRKLAKAGLKHLEQLVAEGGNDGHIAKLFFASTSGYDLVLRLDPSKLSRFRESLSYDPEVAGHNRPKFRNLTSSVDRELIILAEIDPAQCLLKELRQAFGHLALFFHDTYGGDYIGVVWNPKAVQPHLWKVNVSYNVTPALSEDELKANSNSVGKSKGKKQSWPVKPNFPAMAAEMERLGAGLVACVDIINDS